MTDIFISYSRKDVELASTLARTLEELGYSVWWDMSGLHGGQSFSQVIQQKLDEAKCAIVVWSPDSVTSAWVQAEASFADSRGILITAVYREIQAPMPFNTRHNENLRGWNGKVFDEDFQKLLAAVRHLCQVPNGPPTLTETALSKPSEPAKFGMTTGTKAAGLIASVATVVIAAYFLMPAAPPESEPQTLTEKTGVEKVTSSKVYKLANGLTLLPIPTGSFMMGGDEFNREKPVHQVTLDKPFWMSKTEITFEQYDVYAKATGKGLPDDEGWGRGTRPVMNVSWNDAQVYTQWLSANNGEGLQCRLPSEAEWEYAARAGTTTKYPWGDTASYEQANYGADECCNGLAKGRDQWTYTSPVGSFPENQWGLQDMHGNVWEWVQDRWHNDYNGAPSNGETWEVGDNDNRVLRGGSWSYPEISLRSATRTYNSPDDRYDLIGFRVVCIAY